MTYFLQRVAPHRLSYSDNLSYNYREPPPQPVIQKKRVNAIVFVLLGIWELGIELVIELA